MEKPSVEVVFAVFVSVLCVEHHFRWVLDLSHLDRRRDRFAVGREVVMTSLTFAVHLPPLAGVVAVVG